MNWYLVYSGGIHALAALIVILLLAPGATKPNATYTIDFIGSGKVQAVTAPSSAPKAAVQAPEPPKEAVAPAKKEYVSKTEISTKSNPKKKTAKAAVQQPAKPLDGPSVLDDEDENEIVNIDVPQFEYA